MIQDGKNKMRELPEEDINKYKLIGNAGGFSLGFCVYLAQKHAPNFFDRVIGYRIEEHGISDMMNEVARELGLPEDKQKNTTVSFYEEKSIS